MLYHDLSSFMIQKNYYLTGKKKAFELQNEHKHLKSRAVDMV